ncbi:hypothetical protein C8Q69DRAFT_444799 [Paecilomyces variotii]|uniref:Uncharacterized protein n=1 Tax=Byssochlamys spectabilis TaxID=264951 RepID=A0A443HSR9_BYSSP|nr:hypothetical protein C8Q69DRAFT_444799 [Paecilomyces variotii]RWQ94844.1 hypothetical protein C8Q69DRAFT_444799 [Paecilomyces variotii]
MVREEQGGQNRTALRAKRGSRCGIDVRASIAHTHGGPGKKIEGLRKVQKQRKRRRDYRGNANVEMGENEMERERESVCGWPNQRSHWGWHGEDSSSLLDGISRLSLSSPTGQRVSILRDDLAGRQPLSTAGLPWPCFLRRILRRGRHMRVHLDADPGDKRDVAALLPAGHEPISCEPPIHRHNARHRPRWAIVVVHRAEASADVVSPDWRIDLADRFPPLLTTLVEARQQQHLQGLYYRSPASRTAAWPGRSPVRSISLSPPTVAPPTVRWRNADKKLLERR